MENSFSSYPLAAASSSTAPGPEKQGGGGGKGSKAAVKVKLSTDAQSVAARERRHRISERFKILQSLVPGGTKMDTVTMLEEAIHYVKFLKAQIWLHQTMIMSAAGAACLDAGAYAYDGHDHFPTSYAPQKLEDPYHCYDGDQVRGYADPALLQHGFVNSGSNYEDNMFDFS